MRTGEELLTYMKQLRAQGIGIGLTEEEHLESLKGIERVDAYRNSRPAYVRSRYGKKRESGGTSANAGKKVAIYEGVLPDGNVVRKRSFHVYTDAALIECLKLKDGGWCATCVVEGTLPSPTFVKARRLR